MRYPELTTPAPEVARSTAESAQADAAERRITELKPPSAERRKKGTLSAVACVVSVTP